MGSPLKVVILEFKAQLCIAVTKRSEELHHYLSSTLSILFCRLEFFAVLCAAELRKALNSFEPVKIGLTVF
jgi:hypothetical protein